MRRLLTFACESRTLGASFDGEGATGILLVTGGSQTRIGSHRLFESVSKILARNGFPCFRFDRRGVGDSEGGDPGFRGSGPDIAAAIAAFRAECPTLEDILGLGLCDGATALALFGREPDLAGLILVNPWFVEAASGEPPAAAIRRHYRRRLLSLDGWVRIASGSISYRKLWRGLKRIAWPPKAELAAAVGQALRRAPPAVLILAREDATAVAAEAEWNSASFAAVRTPPIYIESDSHTFARPGDFEKLLKAVLMAIETLKPSGSAQTQ